MNGERTLAGWVPLYLKGERIVWGYMGEQRFVEPFCQDTVQKLALKPFNQLFCRATDVDRLVAEAVARPGLPLTGIVFHMSRCGSTLVAQSLASLADSVVLSEPEIVDSLLRRIVASPTLAGERGEGLLSGLLSALGQPRRPEDRRLFLKTDCWHVRHIDRILSSFPKTPWLFLYRDPVDVLVSQSRMPGLFLVPGALGNHGFDPPQELLTKPLEYGAWLLADLLRRAAEALKRHPGGLLMNYSELPSAIETRLAEHFNLDLDDAGIAALRRVAMRDAKNPTHPFQADSAQKRAEAGAAIAELAAKWLDGPYAELERLRCAAG